MLFDCDQIKKETSFRETMTSVSKDSRFLGVSTDIDRERLFDDFLNRRDKKERDEEDIKRENYIDEYRKFLMDSGNINVNSQWREFQDIAKGDPAYENLDKLYRLKIFTEYIKKLELDSSRFKFYTYTKRQKTHQRN